MSGGRTYGTTLSCSCGWEPRPGERYRDQRRSVSNDPPSRGGRAAANDAYRAHVADVLAGSVPACSLCGYEVDPARRSHLSIDRAWREDWGPHPVDADRARFAASPARR